MFTSCDKCSQAFPVFFAFFYFWYEHKPRPTKWEGPGSEADQGVVIAIGAVVTAAAGVKIF